MATYTFKSTYPFKYRFQCEHCGQTTEMKPCYFQEQTTYQSAAFEGKGLRLLAEKKFNEEFAAKIPAMRERVEAGEYELPFGVDGHCPNCKKRQSWEKVKNTGCMFGITAFMGLLAAFSWVTYNTASSIGEGKSQLVWLIVGGFGAFGFLFSLFLGIWGVREKAVIKRDKQNVTVHNKPKFSWPDIDEPKDIIAEK